ncbi:hypothetical protein B6U90_03995 [Thermoplasmatales archaeon ex4484_6]|nr:MAG: hypothetical protein B6U90_03995 [Thermoplasmatales archaeon ex4484_6]RLF66424.1 MAG: hypothetical protein DRN57_07170 [Thermoplasmata archaeon]
MEKDESFRILCPACSEGELRVTSEEMEIPHFGSVLISTIKCSSCGFRSVDVIPVETRPPSRYIARIDDEKDLMLRVIRSGTGILRIPEFGLRISPGTVQEGYISNVEGVLERITGILEQIRNDLTNYPEEFPDSPIRLENTNKLIERISDIREGRFPEDSSITLILEDPMGNSAIVNEEGGGGVEKELLGEKEVIDLTREIHSDFDEKLKED